MAEIYCIYSKKAQIQIRTVLLSDAFLMLKKALQFSIANELLPHQFTTVNGFGNHEPCNAPQSALLRKFRNILLNVRHQCEETKAK